MVTFSSPSLIFIKLLSKFCAQVIFSSLVFYCISLYLMSRSTVSTLERCFLSHSANIQRVKCVCSSSLWKWKRTNSVRLFIRHAIKVTDGGKSCSKDFFISRKTLDDETMRMRFVRFFIPAGASEVILFLLLVASDESHQLTAISDLMEKVKREEKS